MPYSRHKYIYKLSPSIHLGGLFYLHSYWSRLLRFNSALCTNFKTIDMTYQEFKNDYLNLCSKFGRDTKRKILNDLKKDVQELTYRIESIKESIITSGYAYLYGEIYTKYDLSMLEQELQFTNQLISEL